MKKILSALLACAAALIIGTSAAASAPAADETAAVESLQSDPEQDTSGEASENVSEEASAVGDSSPAGILTALAPAALAIVLAAVAAIVSRSGKKNR